MSPSLVARYGEDGPVPHELTDYIKRREGQPLLPPRPGGNPSADFVPDSIVDRFCLLGPAVEMRHRLVSWPRSAPTSSAVYLMHDQPAETLAAYSSEIIPALGLTVPGRRTAAERAGLRRPKRGRPAPAEAGRPAPAEGRPAHPVRHGQDATFS